MLTRRRYGVVGTVPILWSAFSEIYGRKKIYIMSFSLFAVSQIACAVSTNGAMFVIFRIVGAAGSSSALSIGGGTLADIYEPHEVRSLLDWDNAR